MKLSGMVLGVTDVRGMPDALEQALKSVRLSVLDEDSQMVYKVSVPVEEWDAVMNGQKYDQGRIYKFGGRVNARAWLYSGRSGLILYTVGSIHLVSGVISWDPSRS